MSKEFDDFLALKGIKRELPPPHNPSQNGVAERLNQTIQDRIRSMLSHATLSHGFWAKAVKTAIHCINRSPHRALDYKVPEEMWTGKPPSYKHLRVFGCEAYVHVRREDRSKLDPKAQKCIFLGYGEEEEMGYRLWDPTNHKLIRSNDVVFKEHLMPKRSAAAQKW